MSWPTAWKGNDRLLANALAPVHFIGEQVGSDVLNYVAYFKADERGYVDINGKAEEINEDWLRIARNVAEVRVRDGKLVFTDIMGAVTEIDGEIEKIDLMDNYIYISTK